MRSRWNLHILLENDAPDQFEISSSTLENVGNNNH